MSDWLLLLSLLLRLLHWLSLVLLLVVLAADLVVVLLTSVLVVVLLRGVVLATDGTLVVLVVLLTSVLVVLLDVLRTLTWLVDTGSWGRRARREIRKERDIGGERERRRWSPDVRITREGRRRTS